MKLNSTLFFFILTNLLSFLSFWISYPVGLWYSVIALIYLIIRSSSFIGVLFSRKSRIFLFFVILEIVSFINYVILDYSRNIVYENPELLIQGISYLLIPQLLFYYLGFNQSIENQDYWQKNFIVILFIFALVFLYGIYLHFSRPDYFNLFLERIFLNDPETGYKTIYPKFTIYWNSMIVGVLGVAFFWLNILIKNHSLFYRFLFSMIFLTAVVFSTQRGAWLSFLISGLIVLFMTFKSWRPLKYLFYLSLTGVILLFIPKFLVIESNYEIFIDLLNRLDNIEHALADRSNQFDNFLFLISRYPFGIGLGLLSHKASNLGLSLTTPDGNYYRIFGEIGLLGFISFFILIVFSIYKAYKTRIIFLFVILVIFCLQAIGTNVFDLYASSFLFWYIIGFVNGYNTLSVNKIYSIN